MGSRASTLLRDEELEEIKKETGFSHSQITRLYSRFTSLDKGENGTLSREDFQRIPELAINPLGDRIINAFFPEGEDQVNFRGFMRTLAHFRPIEDNEKSKDVNGPEPLNSRSNKLHCKEIKFSGLKYLLSFLTNHLFTHSFIERALQEHSDEELKTVELH
uniref:Calcineurin like EF-hand protein 1 n=1 Tax=Canis lupus familiaris TaxID=9615 RepID=A0A8C0TVM1_CANLF